jgi:SpoU rRNA methylase family enzyme
MQPSTTDPISYPKITLGDAEYELKFRLSDMVNLQKNHQIDLFVATEVKGVAALERLATVIQAGIAHQASKTVEEIMDAIELGELPVYALAVAEAQKKASPASQKALKALQDMTPKAKPNGSVQ